MANTTVFLEGQIYWTRHLTTPDEYLGKKFYKVAMYPTDESLKALKKSGSRTQVKVDDEGKRYINLRRDYEKDFNDGKGPQKLGAPQIVHPDGAVFSSEEAQKIGNGTEATVRVTVYDTKGTYGKGTRLEAMRIDKLVVYEGGGGSPAFPERTTPFSSDSEDLPF